MYIHLQSGWSGRQVGLPSHRYRNRRNLPLYAKPYAALRHGESIAKEGAGKNRMRGCWSIHEVTDTWETARTWPTTDSMSKQHTRAKP